MDGGRDPGSGLFKFSELPQSYGLERDPLAPIAVSDPAARARVGTGKVARLAVTPQASNGSGLIDLDAVARSLEAGDSGDAVATTGSATPQPSFGAGGLALGAVRVDTAAPSAAPSADSEPIAAPPQSRGLLVATIGLLAVVAGLLGYLALA